MQKWNTLNKWRIYSLIQKTYILQGLFKITNKYNIKLTYNYLSI